MMINFPTLFRHGSLTALMVVMTSLLSVSSLQLGRNNNNKNTKAASSILEQAKSENLQAAVLVPGFLTGADEFRSLCTTLTEAGLPTIAVPMPNWHWIACLGGRSMRPMLERIDFTVKHLIANDGDISKVPKFDYKLVDLYVDFKTNPGGVMKVGGSDQVDEYPIVHPRGKFALPPLVTNKKVALIGHSAGGWISRAYLSERNYAGRIYGGSKYVHSLVTLGTPNGDAPGPAFEGIKWCNREPATVRTLAVGSTGFMGGEWGALTASSYSFCCPDGSDGKKYSGDGVTPIFSAIAIEGAETLTLDGCTHFCWSDVFGSEWVAPELTKDHKDGRPWYGSKGVVEKWADWIAAPIEASTDLQW